MSKIRAYLLLVSIIIVGISIASTGLFDLGESFRKIDNKALSWIKRSCINSFYFVREGDGNPRGGASTYDTLVVSLATMDDSKIKFPKALLKAIKKTCLNSRLDASNEAFWEFLDMRVADGYLADVESAEIKGDEKSIAACFNNILKSRKFSIGKNPERKLRAALCARPSARPLEQLRKEFLASRKRPPSEGVSALINAIVASIKSAKFENTRPEMFAYARLHLAVGAKTGIEAAYTSRVKGVPRPLLERIFTKIVKLAVVDPKLPDGEEGVWITIMLDFQTQQVNAIPVNKVRYYGEG